MAVAYWVDQAVTTVVVKEASAVACQGDLVAASSSACIVVAGLVFGTAQKVACPPQPF